MVRRLFRKMVTKTGCMVIVCPDLELPVFRNKTWMKQAASKNAAPWRAWIEMGLQLQYIGARGTAFGKPVCFCACHLSFSPYFLSSTWWYTLGDTQTWEYTPTTAKASVLYLPWKIYAHGSVLSCFLSMIIVNNRFYSWCEAVTRHL